VSPQTLTIDQGTTWGISWPVTENGAPKDISAWSVKAQIRSVDSLQAILHEWSTARGNATVTGGRVALTVTPATSSAWTWQAAIYDVELTSPANDVFRIAQGAVYLSPEVTR
jgi:hypothetical protein